MTRVKHFQNRGILGMEDAINIWADTNNAHIVAISFQYVDIFVHALVVYIVK